MDEGVLYVAAPGTAWPHYDVINGQFSGVISQDWTMVGPVRTATLTISGSRTIEFSVRSSGLNRPSWNVLQFQYIQMLWLSGKFDEYIQFPNARINNGNIVVHRSKGSTQSQLDMTFELFDKPEIFAAGKISGTINNSRVTTKLANNYHSGGWVTVGYTSSGSSWNAPALPPAASKPKRQGSISDLVPGRLIGYRQWRIIPQSEGPRPYRIGSITAKQVWPWTPEMKAYCRRNSDNGLREVFGPGPIHDPDEVPHPECSCGIYAKHKALLTHGVGAINGVIEAWGRIELGSDAFRAQRARIVAFYLRPAWHTQIINSLLISKENEAVIKQVAKTYGVPVLAYDEMMERYPETDIDDLLGND